MRWTLVAAFACAALSSTAAVSLQITPGNVTLTTRESRHQLLAQAKDGGV